MRPVDRLPPAGRAMRRAADQAARAAVSAAGLLVVAYGGAVDSTAMLVAM